MIQRLNPYTVAPHAMRPIQDLAMSITASGLEPSLLVLVQMRVSQINGCAYCLHLHAREARAAGETEDRLHLLATRRESSLYSERERAALDWADALTLIVESRAPDEAYDALKAWFGDEEIVSLTLAVTAINAWNCIAVGFRYAHPREWTA